MISQDFYDSMWFRKISLDFWWFPLISGDFCDSSWFILISLILRDFSWFLRKVYEISGGDLPLVARQILNINKGVQTQIRDWTRGRKQIW